MRGKRKVVNRRNSRLKKIALGILGAGVLLCIVIAVMINHFVNEAYLVEQIESSIQSKAKIGKVELSLLSSPARLTLHDVELSAKEGTGQTSDARVIVKEVDLQVSLWGLLRKRIDVSSMRVIGAQVTGTIHEDGGSSLEALFESAHEKKKKRRMGDGKHQGKVTPREKEEMSGGFNVFDQEDFVASLGGFYIEDSSVDLTIEKSGLRVRCRGLNIEIGSLEIDPKRLEATDKVEMKLSVQVALDSTKGWRYGEIHLDGQASARIFNAESGEMEPDVEGAFALDDRSWLNTSIPVITESWKQLGQLKAIGISIAPLPEKATFGRSESLAAHYHRGKITVQKPLSLWLADWEVAVIDASWLQTETNQHEIQAEVLASKSASGTMYDLLLKAIHYLPSEARKVVEKEMQKKLFRGDRFFVKMKSTGELSKPKIRLVDGVPDFTKAAKKAAEEILIEKAGGLLDGIFGK